MSLLRKYIIGNTIQSVTHRSESLSISFFDGAKLILNNKVLLSNEDKTYSGLVVIDVIYTANDILKLLFDGDIFIQESLKSKDYGYSPEGFILYCADGALIVDS